MALSSADHENLLFTLWRNSGILPIRIHHTFILSLSPYLISHGSTSNCCMFQTIPTLLPNLQTEVNRAYCSFLTKFLNYFYKIFPKKRLLKNKVHKTGWLTKGIKVSGQKLRLLRLLKKTMSMSSKTLNYIKKYQITYKKVISKARKWENNKFILRSANHTKALWQIIKKESGNLKKKNKSKHLFKNRF
jgi:hypothetical protein